MATVRKKAKKAASRPVAKVKSGKNASKSPTRRRSKSAAKTSPAKKTLRKTSTKTKAAITPKKAPPKSLKKHKPTKAPRAEPRKKSIEAAQKRTKSRAARSRIRSAAVEGAAVLVDVSVTTGASKANIEVHSRNAKGSGAKTLSVTPGELAVASSPQPALPSRGELPQLAKQAPAENSTRKQIKSVEPGDTSGSPEIDESGPKLAKNSNHRQGFKTTEFVVYPAHGVGQIVSIEEQEVAGFTLELFVINFAKDKMTLRVPTSKVTGVGMRKLSDPDSARKSLEILTGRPRVKRTMWSRRAQEYETKINSGDIDSIAEVVRDLYRSEAQPEQSYSERQLYEAALDRMAREIAVVQKLDEGEALKVMIAQLQKGQRRGAKPEGSAEAPSRDASVDEAA